MSDTTKAEKSFFRSFPKRSPPHSFATPEIEKIITLSLPPDADLCGVMDVEKLEQIMNIVSKGDTTAIEGLFNKPGGRKFLERVILLVICNLPYEQDDKEDLFMALRKALDKIEYRIKHQKEGQKILRQVYS